MGIAPVVARLRSREQPLAFGTYALLAFLFFGLRLAVDVGRAYAGRGVDPQIYMWSFGWWPHALLHGLNPIHTHAIWAPDGVDLAWTTVTPALALAFAPLTMLVGPLASFDVAFVLMPALAAWTAFLLCRHITRSFWPSLVGGYLFGFSSYMLGQLQGHLHLTSVFLLPLIALTLLRFLQAELGPRDVALRLGVMLALELGLSTEVAFTLTLELAVAIVLGFVLVPSMRGRLASAVPVVLGGYAVAAVIAAPVVWYLLTDFHSQPVNPVSPYFFSTDLANLLVPSDLVAASNGWAHTIFERFQSGGPAESGGYLGVPALVVIVWFAVSRRRSPAARWLIAAFAVTLLIACGAWLTVVGRRVITLPWEHIGYLPLFKNVLTGRLTVFLALITAVVVSIWAASPSAPRRLRILLPALAVLAIAPNLHLRAWATTIREPSFISAGTYKRCLARNENTAIFPFAGFGDSMLWQADADFWFRMTGGYVAPSPPDSFRRPPGVADIAIYGRVPDREVAPLREFLRVKHVSAVVVDGRHTGPWPFLLRGIAKPVSVGGVLVYRLRGPAPCSTR